MSLFDDASLIVTPNGVKEGKLYSIKPSDGSGDLSVTRATTATRVNSAGLVEVVPYNLATYSEQFDNASWTKINVNVSSNTTISPNGNANADTITSTVTGTTSVIVSNSCSVSNAGINVTATQYFKRSNNDWVYLGIGRSSVTTYGEVVGMFNLASGATGSNLTYGAGVFVSLNIESVGNGWYRCSLTANVPNATSYNFYSGSANANGVPFISDIGDAFFAWGGQLVEGTSAKDYYPTTTRLNILRLDYTNGSCPSILVEPQRTNNITYSEEFDNILWLPFESTVSANSTTAPNGTLTADKLVENTNNNTHAIGKSVLGGGEIRTFSVFAKASGRDFIALRLFNGSSSFFAYFNIANGTLGNITSGATSKIESYANGWYKCSITLLLGLGTAEPYIFLSNGNGSISYTGNGTSGAFIWGAQLESGSYATSYIPTTSASVTRNADVISKTGISSLIGQTEGTVFLDFLMANTSTDMIPLSIQGSDGKLIWIRNAGLQFYGNGTTLLANIDSSPATPFLRYKIAVVYGQNDFRLYRNGALIGTDTSGTFTGSFSDLALNSIINHTNLFNQVALFPTRLTNEQLAQLTTI